MSAHHTYEPANWLRELTRVKPARWDWSRAIRTSASIAAPMLLGLAFDQFALSLFVALGALTTALGDGEGSYRSRFRQLTISSLIGVSGFFAGYLNVLPYPAVIATMAALAFVAGIVNSYGAAWSIGTMQALLYAAVAIGMPQIAPFWHPAALTLAGVAFYALMLGAEALVDRRRPERAMLSGLVASLSDLARARAGAPADSPASEAVETARRDVTERSHALYAELMSARRGGRTHETLAHADFLDAADGLFSALMAEGDAVTLQAAADWLEALSGSIAHRGAVPPPATGPASVPSGFHEVPDALAALAAAAASDAVLPRGAHHGLPRPRLPHGELSLSHLTVGRTVLLRAAALSLCIAIAYATRYVFHEEHWYWVPLTVAMVMKPELGSVFVRTVLRAGGTSLGVVIGIALLHFLPQGPYMIAALALIGAFLPLAKSLSYGVQTLVLTPLVLILLELIAPASRGIGYGEQRFLATLIGGLIVLVFGYFLWPRGHARELSQQFDAALGTTAAYLVAAFSGGAGDRAPVIAAERAAYAQLSDLRAALGRSMAEPPPVGREAAAWFPLVVAAERICDRITAGAPAPGSAQRPSEEEIAAVADRLRALVSGAEGVTRVSAPAVMPQDPALRAIAAEAEQLSRRLASVAEGPRHAGPPHPAT